MCEKRACGYTPDMSLTTAPPLSAYISYPQFVDGYQALAFANTQGHIVDAALDVTWALYGITAEPTVAEHHANLLEAMSRWLNDRRLPVLYIWAIEEGASFGLHSHITLHLPLMQGKAFRAFLEAFLPVPVSQLRTPARPGAPFLLQINGGETTFHQWRRFRYTLKSVDPHVGLDGIPAEPGACTLVEACSLNYSFGG
jgi:hypothetical protein